MRDLYRAIPETAFLSGKLPVAKPSDEPLVYLDGKFRLDSKYNKWINLDGAAIPGSSPSIMCRKTVCEMLEKAEKLLPEGYSFVIFDAYRPIAVQQFLWDYFRAKIAEKNPGETDEEIDRLTQFCVSFPSYNILLPSLHNTGGAIDLTIVDPQGRELDMGCEFDDFSESAWTGYYEDGEKGAGLNDVARDNRRILYNVMTSVGFTNFPAEWWHFDYGDEKWALYTNNAPVYAGVLDAEVRNSTAYERSELVREADARQQEAIEALKSAYSSCLEIGEEVASLMRSAESGM